MSVQAVYSTNKSVKDAVKELANKIDIQNPKLILFFASSNYQPTELSSEFKNTFKSSEVIGCTTAGEIVSGKMLSNSVVAMAFDKATIADLKVEVIENLRQNPDVDPAFKNFEIHFGESMGEMDYQKYLGLVLIDGLSGSEEKLMEMIGTRSNLNFVGGSAGDDLKFKQTFVFANGKSYTNAAVLVLLKPLADFDIIKTQSFAVMKDKFTATKVDVEKREVIEFNNMPAIEAYSKAVAKTTENASTEFMTYPFGVMVGDEPFVRSPQQVSGKGIKFYCNIVEGTELTLLRSGDIVEETKNVLAKKIAEVKKISGLINFNCILRTLELQNKNQTEAYGKLFEDIPTIGFSTYGEEYIGHINQTAVMVVFK